MWELLNEGCGLECCGDFTASPGFESASCIRAAFSCVLVVNLVLLKPFTSNPTKPVPSADLWSSAGQATGKQDEGLKMTCWNFIYRLINPRKQFLSLSVMCMLMLKLRAGLICHRETSHRYQSDMVDTMSHFYRNIF